MTGFNVKGIDELEKSIIKLAQNVAPKESQKFMQEQGNLFKKDVKTALGTKFKRKTGNLTNSKNLKRGRVYFYKIGESYQVRIHFAPHTHLLEYGFYNVRARKHIKGKGVVWSTEAAFAGKFEKAVDEFIDKLIEEI